MLVSMKALVNDAHENSYAVMALNSINMEMIRAGIEAASEERSPIIIQMGPGQMARHAHKEAVLPVVFSLAQRAPVPIALNLDHGSNLDDEISAIQAGFTGVMIDASSLPFEENIRRTKIIVALAHPHNIGVEAELGHVGQAADGDGKTDALYTDVAHAKEFVEQTLCDSLAVAIGTAHGKYPKGFVPHLDFDRLDQLKSALGIPLVLHGGSGSGDDNIRRAVQLGINKINVCTDAFQAAKDGMLAMLASHPNADFLDLQIAAETSVKAFVKNYMHLIGSSGRYSYADVISDSNE